MTLKNGCACTSKDIVNSSYSISTRSDELISSRIEAGVKNFVGMTFKRLYALTGSYIPKLCCFVNRACYAVFSSEIKLGARKLELVAFQRMEALSCGNIPNLCSVIETGGEN